jgi:beta-lactamase superfamily II metal-dependent hydrolase
MAGGKTMPEYSGDIWSVDAIVPSYEESSHRTLVRLVSQGPTSITARARYVIFDGIVGPEYRLSSEIGSLQHGQAYLIPRGALKSFGKERVDGLTSTIIPVGDRALLPLEPAFYMQDWYANISRQSMETSSYPLREVTYRRRPEADMKANRCRASILYVGQGDTILFETPMGETWLIDAFITRDQEFSLLQRWIIEINGTGRIDRLVLSHLHYDHIAGALRVVQNLDPKEVLVPASMIPTTGQVSRLLSECSNRGILRKVDDIVEFTDGVMVITIYPSIILSPGLTSTDKDPNHHELVITASSESSYMLLSGDAPYDQLERLPTLPVAGRKVHLKVSHHCSKTGTRSQLLQLLKPTLAVTSCAERNRYHHPHNPPQSLIDLECSSNGGSHDFTFTSKAPVIWDLA